MWKVGNGYQNVLSQIYSKHPDHLKEIHNHESVLRPTG